MNGRIFGRLTVVEPREPLRRVGANGKKRADPRWLCRCECGTELEVFASDLQRGRLTACVKSCALRAGRRPWPENSRYLVGIDGSIVGPHGRVLKPSMHKNGYLSVVVRCSVKGQKRRSVHVIVCEAFHGPRPDGMQVAHKNGVRTDCRAANLSWKTCVENHADRERHGTLLHGEAHPKARLNDVVVREIRTAAARGESQGAIGVRYGIGQGHVQQVVSRKIWRRVA